MNLKPVELQIAIPRTGEAGQMQQQLLQKPVLEQSMLAEQALKELRKRKSAQVDATEESAIREEEGGAKGKHPHVLAPRPRHPAGQSGQEATHPYKGKHIDYSL